MKMTFLSFISIISLLSCGSRNNAKPAAEPEIVSETTAAAAEGVSFSFDKTVHDFGDISVKDGPQSCTFTLTNTGTEDLVVFEVVSSCGCTDVKWTRGTIKPGASAVISATYKNEDGPNAFDKTLTVYITGTKRPVILRLRGVVHQEKKSLSERFGSGRLGDFGIKERSLKTGTLKQGLQVSEQVQVANLGAKPLEVAFTTDSPQLQLSVAPNPIPPGSTATLSYTVTAHPDIYGRHVCHAVPVLNGRKADGNLAVTTWTQENFAGLTASERDKGPLPYFENSTFNFGIVKAGTELEGTFNLTNRGHAPLHIFKADAEDTALTAADTPDVAPGQKGSVRFSLDTSNLPQGECVIMLSLTTNSPLRPLVNLFVAGEIR